MRTFKELISWNYSSINSAVMSEVLGSVSKFNEVHCVDNHLKIAVQNFKDNNLRHIGPWNQFSWCTSWKVKVKFERRPAISNNTVAKWLFRSLARLFANLNRRVAARFSIVERPLLLRQRNRNEIRRWTHFFFVYSCPLRTCIRVRRPSWTHRGAKMDD